MSEKQKWKSSLRSNKLYIATAALDKLSDAAPTPFLSIYLATQSFVNVQNLNAYVEAMFSF
jgi:hypothetical protein